MKGRWFVRGDVDGLFGLFVDNLLQLMLIYGLCRGICQFPDELVTGRILPAAALSILIGNVYYTFQARKLMIQTGRDDITALPYGINTPSLFAYIFIVMMPVYYQTKSTDLAWKAGLFACFFSGLIECIGAYYGDWIRKHTPRAALLSALGGIAITFISMDFVFRIFASPLITIVPMFIILVAYASKVRLPFAIPGGFLAIAAGTLLAWLMKWLDLPSFTPEATPYQFQFHLPLPVISDLIQSFNDELNWGVFSIIIPMGLFNAIGSMQNLESAEAAGDPFPTGPSMMANGIGTLVAACFGSPFPTTIYIGHPAWKAMGARAGYSLVNGIIIALLCSVGAVTLILKIVPLEATLGILLWIGILITAQCFKDVPKHHALAVAIGLIPSLGAWAFIIIEKTLRAAGSSLYETLNKFGDQIFIHGVIALHQGFLLSSMCFSAIMVYLCEKSFLKAAIWMMILALLSNIGLVHAYKLHEHGVSNHFGPTAGWTFGLMYGICAILLFALHFYYKSQQETKSPS